MMMKSLVAALFVAQAIWVPYALAIDVDDGFGSYKDADQQTKLIACEKAIYERNWFTYERDLLLKGGLSTQQAEAAYEEMKEASLREMFFTALARRADDDAYSGRLKQVDASMFDMYERDAAAAVQEYKRLGEYCLTHVYPTLIARNSELAELDTSIRSLRIPGELAKAAKAEFIMSATKRAVK
ncbi:hypothetical protein [Burkholderia sp. LMG 32019]|uniref:hypothetical protein n=1 Tax=Burkholderia sp. LMG 32019 TaxID=3158173 RepID=UPI003C2CDD70